MTSNWDLADLSSRTLCVICRGMQPGGLEQGKVVMWRKPSPSLPCRQGHQSLFLFGGLTYSIDYTRLPAVPGGWGSGEVGLFLVYREL